MSPTETIRVFLFLGAGVTPRQACRLVERCAAEAPSARLCGVLWAASASGGAESLLPGLQTLPLAPGSGAPRGFLRRVAAGVGDALLRLVHAAPRRPNPPAADSLDALARLCNALDCALLRAGAADAAVLLDRVRAAAPDVGIVLGADFFSADALTAPKSGSLRVEADLTVAGAGAPQPGSRAVRVAARKLSPAGRGDALVEETFPVEMFDTQRSVNAKARLLTNDIALRAIAALSPSADAPPPLARPGWASPPAPQPYRASRGYAGWKLLARSAVLLPFVLVRNWARRLRGAFPVVILYHHIVADRPYPDGISTDHFLRQLDFLKMHYRIASLAGAAAMLRAGRVTAPTVVLTFDDGYLENFLNLRAATEEAGVPAVHFVCTQKIARREIFQHDVELGLADFHPFTPEQIRYLHRAGVEIGSHTRTHFNCGSTDAALLRDELVESQRDLEHLLGAPATCFSFPWGKKEYISSPAMELAKKTYSLVLSAYGGANFPAENGDPQHLLRVGHPNDLWELELALQSILSLNLRARLHS